MADPLAQPGYSFPWRSIGFIRFPLREVTAIRSTTPFSLIVYRPKTEEGRAELAKRVADVHASAVTQRIQSLNCPTGQKLELWDAVVEAAKKRSREQT